MKTLITLAFILSFIPYAKAFEGCGEYLLKGILRQNMKEKFRVSYIIHEGTRAQMVMEMLNQEDFLKIEYSLNRPSSLRVKILSPFDGTKGKIGEVLELKPRISNPLSATDEGLEKLSPLKCLSLEITKINTKL